KVQAGRYLAVQRIPGGSDVRRAESSAIPLCTQVGGAGQDQRAVRHVAPEALVKRRGMRQRIDIIQTGPGRTLCSPLRSIELERSIAHQTRSVKEAVGYQVRLGFRTPQVVEAVLHDLALP